MVQNYVEGFKNVSLMLIFETKYGVSQIKTSKFFGNFNHNHNRNQKFYPQLTVTITINSLQKRVITGNKKP